MTVVVYSKKTKTMASDSLEAEGEYYFGNCRKLYRLSSGAILGTAGNSEMRAMFAIFDGVLTQEQFPTTEEMSKAKCEISWLLVLPDNSCWHVYSFFNYDKAHTEDAWECGIVECPGQYAAVGHGMDWALACMDCGGTVQEAVKLACRRSLFCGLPIQVLSLGQTTKQKRNRKKITVMPESVEHPE